MSGSKPFARRRISRDLDHPASRGAPVAGAAAPALAGVTVGGGVWEWQSPVPQGNRLYGVEVTPGGTAWTVGAPERS